MILVARFFTFKMLVKHQLITMNRCKTFIPNISCCLKATSGHHQFLFYCLLPYCPDTMAQTLHNWAYEELSGRPNTTALLPGEGHLEERCKQVVPIQRPNQQPTRNRCT